MNRSIPFLLSLLCAGSLLLLAQAPAGEGLKEMAAAMGVFETRFTKGDPAARRSFLDDLVISRWPRMLGVKLDYDKVVRQRNALLKSLLGTRPDAEAEFTIRVQCQRVLAGGAGTQVFLDEEVELKGGESTTLATPLGEEGRGQAYAITGHKWFFSAPMCDAHLVVARTSDQGNHACFFVPRWRFDGTRNAVSVERLKDKVGNQATFQGTSITKVFAPAKMDASSSSVTGMNVNGPGNPAYGASVTITFTNNGGVAATLGATAVSLSNTTNFEVVSATCTNNLSVAAGSSCNVVVRPKATADGALSGTLTLNWNSSL